MNGERNNNKKLDHREIVIFSFSFFHTGNINHLQVDTPLNTLTLVLVSASARTHKRILHWNSLTLYMSTVSQYSQQTSWQITHFLQKCVRTASSDISVMYLWFMSSILKHVVRLLCSSVKHIVQILRGGTCCTSRPPTPEGKTIKLLSIDYILCEAASLTQPSASKQQKYT